MQVYYNLDDIPPLTGPIAFTLGSFDGVHLGHQHLFKELKKRGKAVVLTFVNHPSEILSKNPITQLLTLEQKLQLLKTYGIDIVIALPFTKELALVSYDTFLKKLREKIPFSTLVLGEGAVFGHAGLGTEENVKRLASEMGFEALYLPKLVIDQKPVSSRRIRELMQNGNFSEVKTLLGRENLW